MLMRDSTGVSIGAFVGGLYAHEGDVISSAARVKKFSSRMGNIWRILSDVTYPIVAYTTVSSECLLAFYLTDHIRGTNSIGQYTRSEQQWIIIS
jgi:predicted acylesterase/phospholipase RssA